MPWKWLLTALGLCALLGPPRDGRGSHHRRLDRRGPGDLGRRPQRPQRHRGRHIHAGADPLPHRRLPRLHAGIGGAAEEPRPRRGRQRRHPRAADPRRRRRQHPRALQEPGHRVRPAALHALPRRALRVRLRRRLHPGLLRARGQRAARASRSRTGCSPRRTRPARGPTTTTGPRCTTRSRAGCTARFRSAAAARAARPRERRRLRRAHGFETVNGKAFVGNTPIFRAKVGDLVQWDVVAIGDEFHTFHVHGHRWVNPDGTPEDCARSAPPRASACAGARISRARGSTTATSRATWRPAWSGSTG